MYYGRGAQDVHLVFHTAPELCMDYVPSCAYRGFFFLLSFFFFFFFMHPVSSGGAILSFVRGCSPPMHLTLKLECGCQSVLLCTGVKPFTFSATYLMILSFTFSCFLIAATWKERDWLNGLFLKTPLCVLNALGVSL